MADVAGGRKTSHACRMPEVCDAAFARLYRPGSRGPRRTRSSFGHRVRSVTNLETTLADRFLAGTGSAPVEWLIAEGLTGYEEAVAFMEARADAIAEGRARELVWLRGASAALHGGHVGQDAGPHGAGPLSGPPDRAGRAIHLSRPGPAGGLCDAGPQAPAAGPAPLRGGPGGLADRDPRTTSTSAASGGRTGSGSGSGARTRARRPRTRSPPSASGSAAGSAFTASA